MVSVAPRKELTGERFCRLEVLRWLPKGHEDNPKEQGAWECLCDCGNVTYQGTHQLAHGKARSCGCKRATSHGMSRSRIYHVWFNMLKRCYVPTEENYCNYGGRGITVCEEWHDFETWYDDIGKDYKKGLYLDRIDNDEPYCKENCKWSTMKEQHRNKRSNVWYEYDGKKYIQTDLLELGNVDYGYMRYRAKRGRPLNEAFGLPLPVKKIS